MIYTQTLFIGTTEVILIAAVVLLLFGGKKLPELMHGMGQGVRSFKEGMNDITTDRSEEEKKDVESGKDTSATRRQP